MTGDDTTEKLVLKDFCNVSQNLIQSSFKKKICILFLAYLEIS